MVSGIEMECGQAVIAGEQQLRFSYAFGQPQRLVERAECQCMVAATLVDLTVDDHACLTFGEPEDLFDLTAAFVRDGLACGLKVVWISDSAPQRATSELARRGVAVESALAAGQLAAAECEGRLLSGQEFGAGRAWP